MENIATICCDVFQGSSFQYSSIISDAKEKKKIMMIIKIEKNILGTCFGAQNP